MAEVNDLRELPDDIGDKYLKYPTTLRQRQQGRKYSKGSYIDGLKIYRTDSGEIQIKTNIYRSQLRNGEPHQTSLSVDVGNKGVSEAICGCKGGYVVHLRFRNRLYTHLLGLSVLK